MGAHKSVVNLRDAENFYEGILSQRKLQSSLEKELSKKSSKKYLNMERIFLI